MLKPVFGPQAGLFSLDGNDSPEDSYSTIGHIYSGGPKIGEEKSFYAKLSQNPESFGDIPDSDQSLVYAAPGEKKLTLFGDSCGQNQVFFAQTVNNGWAWAFSLPDLFRLLGGAPEDNQETLYDFLATHYRYVFREPSRTFHKGVFKVPSGSYVTLGQGQPQIKSYLKLDFDPSISKLTPQEAARLYVDTLDEIVGLRLSKLEGSHPAFAISSGLDSSSVATLAARRLGRPLSAWFMAYRSQSGSPYDESAGVEALIKATGWELNRLDLEAPELLGETERLLELTRAPVITVTWLAHYLLARAAAGKGYRYIFSGLGGDESLAGEFDHFFLFFADLRASGQEELLERETTAWVRLHDHPVFKKSPQVREEWFRRNIDFPGRLIRPDMRRYLANREYFDQGWVEDMESRIPPVPMPHPYPYFLSNRLYQEMTYETSPPTLWSEFLAGEAGGLRGVFPMANPRLFRLALSLPGTFKYRDGLTKMLIRRGMEGILPDCSRLNPVKTGFNAPLDMWLRDGKLCQEALELYRGSPLARRGYLAPGAMERILKEHSTGERNHMMLLWPIISSAIFLKINSRKLT
jgi:asparagine synthase (glutamine-hydrolysing)